MADKKVLVFYHPLLLGGEGGHTLETIKEYRAALAKEFTEGVLLRDITMFSGDVEGAPDGISHVFVLAPEQDDFDEDQLEEVGATLGRSIKPLYEAFEAVGIEIEKAPDIGEEDQGSEEEPDDPASVMSILKAEATELGINFSHNIGEASLRAKIEKQRRENPEDDSGNGNGGSGDGQGSDGSGSGEDGSGEGQNGNGESEDG